MATTIQRLILVWGLALLAGLGAAQAAERPDHRHYVAVVIGNKTYKSRIPEVAYAHRDADAMKAYLTQVLGYREPNIIDLRDATQAEMSSAFGNERSHEGEIWSFLRPGKSHVTVFYSGHGVPGQRDKRGYLLPVDANPDTPEINGYPVDVLYENLSKLEAASVTVYLDASFSGESDQGMLIRSASPVFAQASLPEAAGGLTVLTAASADQIASWDEENQHGLFTWHLLQALQGAADKEPFGNGDGSVTVAETRAYLDEEMSYAARRHFRRKQTASVQGTGETLLVVAEVSVNTRAGPGTSFEKVEVLSRGTTVEVTGKVEGKDWYRIALAGGRTAYIFGPLLRDASPAQPAVGIFPKVEAVPLPAPGERFRDCDVCPEMVTVPAGSFQMGAPPNEEGRLDKEGPVHLVTIGRAFAVGKYEVTFAEWDACVADGGCNGHRPDDRGWGRGSRPVIKVNWKDANAYTAWLSRKTGKRYRLLSEAEWEYAARAGTTTARFWGDGIGSNHANCEDCGSQWDNRQTAPAGSFAPNAFGLHDMLGNVWEWTADCWNDSYAGAPSDGSAWTVGDCRQRALRGGGWSFHPYHARSARRRGWPAGDRKAETGFRVARTDALASPVQPELGGLTKGDMDLLNAQIARCWSVPAGARDAEDLNVEIRVEVNPDMTVRSARITDVARMNSDPFYRTAAESALRAVLNPRCSPLQLPPGKYEEWRSMVLSFNPKEMFGL